MTASISAARRILSIGDATIPDIVPMAGDENGCFHISLSRTFVLRHEQIDGFVEDLRQAVRWTRR
jgi:hypothetical protein